MRETGVIYLYRFSDGEAPARRFVQSYRDHRAGLDHDLIVVFKGFPDQEKLLRGQTLFDGAMTRAITVDDTGFDIGSYLQAARASTNRRLVFLNTSSELLADDWLKHLACALDRPGVGVAGATGSWLSITAHFEGRAAALLRGAWRLIAARRSPGGQEEENIYAGVGEQTRLPRRQYLLAPIEYLRRYLEFGRFPNPHIRTNAFMIDRECFLSLSFPDFKRKRDAYRFESGRRSMTRQVMAKGLRPVVVGRSGHVYDIPNWSLSGTFWVDDQENLLVADNRTTDYKQANLRLRRFLEDIAWIHPWDWNTRPVRSHSSRF